MLFNGFISATRCAFVALIGLALLAGGCGSSASSMTAPSSSSALVTIFITNGVYSPNPLTVKVGQQINWKNNDSIAHSATSTSFDTGSIAPFSAHDNPVTMSTAGTLTFHCSLHAGETGSIVVQP
jgi:plastocyanin